MREGIGRLFGFVLICSHKHFDEFKDKHLWTPISWTISIAEKQYHVPSYKYNNLYHLPSRQRLGFLYLKRRHQNCTIWKKMILWN